MSESRALHLSVPTLSPALRDYLRDQGLRPAGIAAYCKEALAEARKLCTAAGIPAGRQRALAGKAATVSAAQAAIEDAARSVPDGGMFVLSFAGHGVQVVDESSDELDDRDEAWCLYDWLVPDDELGALLSRFRAKAHVVVVSDACDSGGMVEWRGGSLLVRPGGVTRPRSASAARPKPRARLAMFGSAGGTRVVADGDTLAAVLRQRAFIEPGCASYRQLAERIGGAGVPRSERATSSFSPESVEKRKPFVPWR